MKNFFFSMFERAVQQLDQDGNVLATYPNATRAAGAHGKRLAVNISATCNGKRKSAFGFGWRHEPQPDLIGEIWNKHPTLDIKLSNLGRLENSRGRRTYGSSARNGYMNYMEKRKSYGIHRLVFQAFNPNAIFEVVHHLNRIRNDNRLVNLEGCTQKENIQAYHDLIPKPPISYDLHGEVWKYHPRFNFQFSNMGRVKHYDGKNSYGMSSGKGYKGFKVEDGTVSGMHRLVFESFNPEVVFAVVNHKNRNRSDNRLENLEGCTQKENIQAYHNLIPKLY